MANFLVAPENQPPGERIVNVAQRGAAVNTAFQRLDFLRFTNGAHLNAVEGAAVNVTDDDILRHFHHAPSKIACVRRAKRGVRQTLTRAMRGDEVFEDA
ncbi:MAG: hypothetical protein BWY76_00249 [bacterium ADurb.Bin429]|nr:MAG: hypothetical protein BWY76_00249 [bacterium ADurb.Bin429]